MHGPAARPIKVVDYLAVLPASFLSVAEIRNVLVHVRCDVRDGAAGERVLLLHKVQSDWAQVRAEQLPVAKWTLVMMGARRF